MDLQYLQKALMEPESREPYTLSHAIYFLPPLHSSHLCFMELSFSFSILGIFCLSLPAVIPPTTKSPTPTTQQFTLNFTITNLRFTPDLGRPGSPKFSTTEKIMRHFVSLSHILLFLMVWFSLARNEMASWNLFFVRLSPCSKTTVLAPTTLAAKWMHFGKNGIIGRWTVILGAYSNHRNPQIWHCPQKSGTTCKLCERKTNLLKTKAGSPVGLAKRAAYCAALPLLTNWRNQSVVRGGRGGNGASWPIRGWGDTMINPKKWQLVQNLPTKWATCIHRLGLFGNHWSY